MIITNYHVQQVLKTYSQQLSARSRASRSRSGKDTGHKDEVTLSQESRKMLMVDKIVKETIAQMANGLNRSETNKAILDQLSQEYGRPLDVDAQSGNGISFKVLTETGEGVLEYLSPQENEQLRRRLFDIAQSFVYRKLA